MKKIFILLALIASLRAFDAQAQPKTAAAAKAAVEKAKVATTNPKKNTKTATWIKYAKSLVDAYNVPSYSIWVGMSQTEYQVISQGINPLSREQVVLSGRSFTKLAYTDKNIYFNESGVLEIIEVTNPAIPNALDEALVAYGKAAEYDLKAQKTKDINIAIEDIASKYSMEASNAFTFGDVASSSILFEKAAVALATEPLSKIDTTSIYNAGLTSWIAGNYDRAKKFYLDCVELGYLGNDGDTYAKLADIADKAGNKQEAKQYLETGFTAFPQSQSILIGLINYYLSSGEDTNRLFDLLQKAKENEPNNASLYYVEGNIRLELKQPEEAVAAYRKCAEINPNYEYGYIGEGIYFYNNAVEIQEKAATEMDDNKYMALMGEFETSLKNCIEPFEKAFQISKDNEVKKSIAEYLKNACFRFRTSGDEFKQKYEFYNSFLSE